MEGQTLMELNVETLYRSRGTDTVVEDGKVRIEILYSMMVYKEGPVPGGYMVEQSTHRCNEFMVACSPALVDSSLGSVYDNVVGAGFNINLKEEFLCKMIPAVIALPGSTTTADGVLIVPELLATLRVQTRSTLGERGRRIIPTGHRRMLSDNNNMNNATEGVRIVPERLVVRILSGREAESASERSRMVLERCRRRRRLNNNNVEDYPRLERIRWADVSQESEDEEWRCSVCLETCISDDQEVIRLLCKHMYHPHCITEWLPRSCPTCRRSPL